MARNRNSTKTFGSRRANRAPKRSATKGEYALNFDTKQLPCSSDPPTIKTINKFLATSRNILSLGVAPSVPVSFTGAQIIAALGLPTTALFRVRSVMAHLLGADAVAAGGTPPVPFIPVDAASLFLQIPNASSEDFLGDSDIFEDIGVPGQGFACIHVQPSYSYRSIWQSNGTTPIAYVGSNISKVTASPVSVLVTCYVEVKLVSVPSFRRLLLSQDEVDTSSC
jgi:hypothetical protein